MLTILVFSRYFFLLSEIPLSVVPEKFCVCRQRHAYKGTDTVTEYFFFRVFLKISINGINPLCPEYFPNIWNRNKIIAAEFTLIIQNCQKEKYTIHGLNSKLWHHLLFLWYSTRENTNCLLKMNILLLFLVVSGFIELFIVMKALGFFYLWIQLNHTEN